MKTERLYYASDDLQRQAQVLACDATDDGRYAVVLAATLFHPQGGGQRADTGMLGGKTVLHVSSRGDEVVHLLAEPLPLGPVDMQVDGEIRLLHSRWHSAGHLIGWLGENRGWQPVKAHHWPGEGRITFAPGAAAQTVGVDFLQASLEGLIAADLSRVQVLEQGGRQVGFGELPAYSCGGTHVRSLAELVGVLISAVKMKKGQLVVHYGMA